MVTTTKARQVGKTATLKDNIVNELGTIYKKWIIINELETIYKKWIINDELPAAKTLVVNKKKYTFTSPIELYRFIQGARFIMME
jgi:hypothetical protein